MRKAARDMQHDAAFKQTFVTLQTPTGVSRRSGVPCLLGHGREEEGRCGATDWQSGVMQRNLQLAIERPICRENTVNYLATISAALAMAAATLLIACASTMPSKSSSPNATVLHALAPGGTLRAAINFGNPILANKDAKTGEPFGVSIDIARELGKRLHVPVELVLFNAAGKVVDAVSANEVSIAFVAIDPVRATTTAYTAPYVIIEGAYLVRDNSSLRDNAEVDRAGTRVVVGAGSAYDLYLTREMKNATLVRAPTSPLVTDEMLRQNLEVAAGVKQQLQADALRVGGVRLLPGRFMVINQALAMPLARAEAADSLKAFIEELKATGFVANALERHGIKGALVAPLAP